MHFIHVTQYDRLDYSLEISRCDMGLQIPVQNNISKSIVLVYCFYKNSDLNKPIKTIPYFTYIQV